MKDQTKKMDLIDKYLEKSLSPDDEKTFEQELTNDPEMMQEMQSYKLLVDGIRLGGRKNLKRMMSEWHEQSDETDDIHGVGQNRFSFRWYYAAAAILVLMVSVFVIVKNIGEDQYDIVARHYQPFVFMPEQTRGETAIVESAQIFHYYERGEYLKVIESINQTGLSGKSDITQFMLANSYQALDKFEEAISIYESIINANSDYLLGAKWYLSLCYLSVDKSAEAKIILGDLINSSSSFAFKAETLLSDLD